MPPDQRLAVHSHSEEPLPAGYTFETRALHADGHFKPMNTHNWPIFQTSTFMFDSPDHGAALFAGRVKGHIYSSVYYHRYLQLVKRY